uniref:Uncharacterized protein n=1 Tax=Arion vulgaris TaxID=1028688 RepID=A0A0B7B7V4_9EUPU
MTKQKTLNTIIEEIEMTLPCYANESSNASSHMDTRGKKTLTTWGQMMEEELSAVPLKQSTELKVARDKKSPY